VGIIKQLLYSART